MNNMNQLMKQAKKLQEDMAKAQEELERSTVVGAAGGGVVEIEMSGAKAVTAVHIKPEALETGDVEVLEDLVLAAIVDAQAKADALAQERLGKYTKNLNMPGLF
jgi:DNA-binding YbaB/EbfC family protein